MGTMGGRNRSVPAFRLLFSDKHWETQVTRKRNGRYKQRGIFARRLLLVSSHGPGNGFRESEWVGSGTEQSLFQALRRCWVLFQSFGLARERLLFWILLQRGPERMKRRPTRLSFVPILHGCRLFSGSVLFGDGLGKGLWVCGNVGKSAREDSDLNGTVREVRGTRGKFFSHNV